MLFEKYIIRKTLVYIDFLIKNAIFLSELFLLL